LESGQSLILFHKGWTRWAAIPKYPLQKYEEFLKFIHNISESKTKKAGAATNGRQRPRLLRNKSGIAEDSAGSSGQPFYF